MSFKFTNFKYVYRFLSAYIFLYIAIYVCFPNFKKLQSHRNALYLSIILFLGCSYIIFIKPTYFKLGDEMMPKWVLYSFYLAFHILPFVLVLNKQHQLETKYNKTESLIPCLLVGLIYLSFFNPKKIYNINFTDMIIITLSSAILFYFIESFYV